MLSRAELVQFSSNFGTFEGRSGKTLRVEASEVHSKMRGEVGVGGFGLWPRGTMSRRVSREVGDGAELLPWKLLGQTNRVMTSSKALEC